MQVRDAEAAERAVTAGWPILHAARATRRRPIHAAASDIDLQRLVRRERERCRRLAARAAGPAR
jgi:hypothetical protein